MGARFQINVKCGSGGIFSRVENGGRFGMRPAEFLVGAFSYQAAVFNKHGADQRVRMDRAPAAFGQAQSHLHIKIVANSRH